VEWAAPKANTQGLRDSRCEHASESRNLWRRASWSFQAAGDCVEDLLDADGEHRRRGSLAAAVRGSLGRSVADHDIVFRERAVTSRVGGTVQADDGRAQRGGKMQRASVRGDYKFGAEQERDQLRQIE